MLFAAPQIVCLLPALPTRVGKADDMSRKRQGSRVDNNVKNERISENGG